MIIHSLSNKGRTLIEKLQRRIAYGGRKGRSAARKLKKLVPSNIYCTDQKECRKFFTSIKTQIGFTPP